MRRLHTRLIAAAAIGLTSVMSAAAQNRADYERADAALTQAIEAKLADIGRRSTYADRVAEARSRFLAAQAEWQRFRESECAAHAAVAILISARTPEGLTAACLYELTERRIKDIAEY